MRAHLLTGLCLFAVATIPASGAGAQSVPDPAAPTPPARSTEIEVRGKREIDREVVAENLRELTTRIPVFDAVPRFFEPLCLHVIGPDEGTSRVIAERIMEAAAEGGLEKPKSGCRENAFVIIVDEPKRLFDRLVARRHSVVGEIGRDATLRELRDELKSGKPAIVWNRSTFMLNGTPSVALPGSVPIQQHPIGSRIPGRIQRPKVLSVIVFDADLIGAATPVQLGDYAALQLLATPRRNIDFDEVSARSILSLFADGPDMAPDSLTAFDRAYLAGVYENTGRGLRGPVTRMTLAAYESECADEKPDCQFVVPPEGQ